MRNFFTLFIFIGIVFIATITKASWEHEPYNRTFVQNKKEQPNIVVQQHLRESEPWKNFSANHNQWRVVFDERNGMPHRVYGNGFYLSGNDATNRARNFISSELSDFGVSNDQLLFRKSFSSKKYKYVDFYQQYNELEVL